MKYLIVLALLLALAVAIEDKTSEAEETIVGMTDQEDAEHHHRGYYAPYYYDYHVPYHYGPRYYSGYGHYRGRRSVDQNQVQNQDLATEETKYHKWGYGKGYGGYHYPPYYYGHNPYYYSGPYYY